MSRRLTLAGVVLLALGVALALPAVAQDPPPNGDGNGDETDDRPRQRSHEVQEGDTLESISRLYYGTPDRAGLIQRVNRLADARDIYPGLVLIIPPVVDTTDLEGWAGAVRHREPITLPGDPVTRTCLRGTATHLYYLRIWWPIEDEEDDAEEDGDNDGLDDSGVPPPPPQALRRAICRVPADPDVAGREEELLDVGFYGHHFFVTPDGNQLVALRQTEDTNEDGNVDRADARELVVGPPDGSAWRVVWRGSGESVLAAVVPGMQRALVMEPTPQPFVYRILSVSLAGTVDDGRADRVRELTTGITVECITPDEQFAVVARLGEPEEPDRFRFNRGRPANLTNGEGDDFALGRPPVHVLVPLEPGSPESESVLVPGGEAWGRVVFIEEHRAWMESLEVPPQHMGNEQHPVWQSRNLIAYVDRQNLTVIPVTSDAQYDDQLIARLPGRGVLYLHNTNINRHLTVFAGGDAHVQIHELSPLSLDFALVPETRMLWFFEYAADSAPFHPLHTPTRIRGLSLSDE